MIEALASVAVAAGLLIGILGYFTTAYVGLHRDGTRSQAVSQAQGALEATRGWLMDLYGQGAQNSVKHGGRVRPADLEAHGFQPLAGMETTVDYQYQERPPGWELTVKTFWQVQGRTQTYEITSFFGDYDHAKSRESQ